jgi:crotonobetainyl-CoA:carnitine CoA-transferase CaiB-like acyl-CoA transferase
VFTDAQWQALAGAVRGLADDDRFATRAARAANDQDLIGLLTREFATESAESWQKVLDQAGVPCEVSSPEFPEHVLDDPELRRKEWIVTRAGHRRHGRMDMFGKVLTFSDTQAPIGGPPDIPGQHSREILREAGYSDAQIDELCTAQAVFEADLA